MWLLKLHFAFSILCTITYIGFRAVFRNNIKKNGWLTEEKKKSALGYGVFFVPLLNVLCVLVMFAMIGIEKDEFENTIKEQRDDA